jgi:hypothetical protein
MLLKPGMTFFLRPNTPHAVFTTEHCITYGSHFVATSTLRETCYGVVHSFISSSTITNADNNDMWIILVTSRLIDDRKGQSNQGACH